MTETKEQRNQENWFFLSYVASGLDFFSRFGVHLTLIVRWDLEPFEPRFPSCDLGEMTSWQEGQGFTSER